MRRDELYFSDGQLLDFLHERYLIMASLLK